MNTLAPLQHRNQTTSVGGNPVFQVRMCDTLPERIRSIPTPQGCTANTLALRGDHEYQKKAGQCPS